MSIQNPLDDSPGYQLKFFLKGLYPLEIKNEQTILLSIDKALQNDNKLHETIYESTINYMVRRLITLSRFIYRKYKDDETQFVKKLRRFVEQDLNFPKSETEKLLTILADSARVAGRPLRAGRTTDRYKKGGNNQRCYMCGKSVSHPKTQDLNDAATLDHLFPNALGGSNSDINLKIACGLCNRSKKSIIDGTDFHYESLCLITDSDEESFDSDITNSGKIALWAKHNFRCNVCDKDAVYMGELQLGRINTDDSWHYFNIAAYCYKHHPDNR